MLKKTSSRIHAFLVGNVVLSLLIFGVVLYFSIIGEYSNLQDRSAIEAMLNSISMGSLFYAGVFLTADLVAKPFLCPLRQK